MYFIAPYWADNDARLHGSMSWEMYSVGYGPKTDDIITNVTNFIRITSNNMEFSGNLVFVANWNEMHPYPAGISVKAALPYLHMVSVSLHLKIIIAITYSAQNNSYQAVLVTDGINKSFAIFTFKCGSLGWSGRATVGFNAGGSYYANHPLSRSKLSNAIACANPDSEWNNIVYDLTSIESGSGSISGSGSGSGSGSTRGSGSGYGDQFDSEGGE